MWLCYQVAFKNQRRKHQYTIIFYIYIIAVCNFVICNSRHYMNTFLAEKSKCLFAVCAFTLILYHKIDCLSSHFWKIIEFVSIAEFFLFKRVCSSIADCSSLYWLGWLDSNPQLLYSKKRFFLTNCCTCPSPKTEGFMFYPIKLSRDSKSSHKMSLNIPKIFALHFCCMWLCKL